MFKNNIVIVQSQDDGIYRPHIFGLCKYKVTPDPKICTGLGVGDYYYYEFLVELPYIRETRFNVLCFDTCKNISIFLLEDQHTILIYGNPNQRLINFMDNENHPKTISHKSSYLNKIFLYYINEKYCIFAIDENGNIWYLNLSDDFFTQDIKLCNQFEVIYGIEQCIDIQFNNARNYDNCCNKLFIQTKNNTILMYDYDTQIINKLFDNVRKILIVHPTCIYRITFNGEIIRTLFENSYIYNRNNDKILYVNPIISNIGRTGPHLGRGCICFENYYTIDNTTHLILQLKTHEQQYEENIYLEDKLTFVSVNNTIYFEDQNVYDTYTYDNWNFTGHGMAKDTVWLTQSGLFLETDIGNQLGYQQSHCIIKILHKNGNNPNFPKIKINVKCVFS